MKGIQNFLYFINENYVSILICIGLVIGIVRKVSAFLSKSTEKQIEIAKRKISQIMLKMISNAEIDWKEWEKSGSIKRSQVVKDIFDQYPILSKASDQDEVIDFIDSQIKESLKTLREIMNNKNQAS